MASQQLPQPPQSLQQSINAGYKLVRDANLQGTTVPRAIGCVLAGAPARLEQTLALATHTHPKTLLQRQIFIRALRDAAPRLAPTWNARFSRIAALEGDLTDFFSAGSKGREDLEEDAVAQLSFQHALLKPLNGIPFLVTAVALFKIWIVPTMTILTPLLAWILPYLLLRFVYALPIRHDQYMSLLRSLWLGNFSGPMPAPGDPLPSLYTPKSLAQAAFFAFTFLQSIIQPVQAAMHLYSTDQVFLRIGDSLLKLKREVEEFREDLKGLGAAAEGIPLSGTLAVLGGGFGDSRLAFLAVSEDPQRLHLALKDVTQLEIFWRLATSPLQPVTFKKDALAFEGLMDLSLPSGVAVASDVQLMQPATPHAVITGPNGGGKSSFLRSILQAVLFGLSYGVAPAKQAFMPRFLWIASGLQLRDTPGVLSMFETEVKFAADALRLAAAPAPDGPGLILFDELFHSTNPPDGTRTAERFLHELWASPPTHLFSVVSTHVFSLLQAAPEHVALLCCAAEEGGDGEIRYKYRAEPGICTVSSVRKVWERFGLSGAGAAAAARPVQSGQNPSTKEN